MSEHDLIASTATDMFTALCPPHAVQAANGWLPELAVALAETGFDRASIPEALGGAGGPTDYAAALIRIAARHAAPFPLLEGTLLAGWALSQAGIPVPEGVLTVALDADAELAGRGDAATVSGIARRVPWARAADALVLVVDVDGEANVLCLDLNGDDGPRIVKRSNAAGEPRDEVHLRQRVDPACLGPVPGMMIREALLRRAALGRAVQIAGALDRVLELTVAWTAERKQFGRSLDSFQAVQQQLALLAGEVASVAVAVDAAVTEIDDESWMAALAARVRAAAAAGVAATIAHQLHGAIGFTEEHPLPLFTRRLWAWRDEFGSQREWSVELGRRVVQCDRREVWSLLTAGSGAR